MQSLSLDRPRRGWKQLAAPSILLLLLWPAWGLLDFIFDRFQVGPDSPIRAGWRQALQVLGWLFAAQLVNRVLRWLFFDGIVTRAMQGPAPRVLKDLVSVLVYLAAGAAITFFVFGRSITAFLATIGAGSIVIGWALRGLLADVFAGLALNFERPFAIGDWLRVSTSTDGSIDARVREINWRSTHLETEDGRLVVLPNSRLADDGFANYSRPGSETRFDVRLTIDFSVPSRRVFRVLQGAAKGLMVERGFVAERDPQVLIEKTNELGVEYKVRFWIWPWKGISPGQARSRMLERLLFHLRQAGIAPAYPKEDHYTAPLPQRHLECASPQDLVRLLGGVDLFRKLGPPERETLAECLQERRYHEGSMVIEEGSAGDSMFILMEGLLDVLAARDGKMTRVAQLEPGEFFGEMSLLTGAPRSATIVAAVESVAFEVQKDTIDRLLRERPALAEDLARTVAERETRSRLALDSTREPKEVQVERAASQLLAKISGFFGLTRLDRNRR